MKTMKVTALTLGCLFAGSAFAGTAESFSELDKDRDGFVSIEEAKADKVIATSFTSLDLDNNGLLTWKEYSNQVANSGSAKKKM